MLLEKEVTFKYEDKKDSKHDFSQRAILIVDTAKGSIGVCDPDKKQFWTVPLAVVEAVLKETSREGNDR
jgi:hypothetical protein